MTGGDGATVGGGAGSGGGGFARRAGRERGGLGDGSRGRLID